jgi:hypothetical protein
MRSRFTKIVYLTAIAVAMAGWIWLIFGCAGWMIG